jgi:hypothetical protein
MSNLVVMEHDLRLEAPPEMVKLIAVTLNECRNLHHLEYPTTLSDFIFNMEAAYQDYHGLDQDDWGFVREDAESLELTGELLLEVSDA